MCVFSPKGLSFLSSKLARSNSRTRCSGSGKSLAPSFGWRPGFVMHAPRRTAYPKPCLALRSWWKASINLSGTNSIEEIGRRIVCIVRVLCAIVFACALYPNRRGIVRVHLLGLGFCGILESIQTPWLQECVFCIFSTRKHEYVEHAEIYRLGSVSHLSQTLVVLIKAVVHVCETTLRCRAQTFHNIFDAFFDDLLQHACQ